MRRPPVFSILVAAATLVASCAWRGEEFRPSVPEPAKSVVKKVEPSPPKPPPPPPPPPAPPPPPQDLEGELEAYAVAPPPSTELPSEGDDLRGLAASWKDPLAGMEFLLVPGGCYAMGDATGAGFADEGPVHEVCVSPFYMGKYEVTVEQFREFAEATGYLTEGERKGGCVGWDGRSSRRTSALSWRNPGFPQQGNHPVACVSYRDAEAFAEWMSKGGRWSFRLPTEAEWEYAARGGGKLQPFAWAGPAPSGNVADGAFRRRFPEMEGWDGYDDGSAFTAPAGSHPPGALGIHDLTGNVWEWCLDWNDDRYYGYSPRQDPAGPADGETRSLRGGSWFCGPGTSRNTYRYRLDPSDRFDDTGFRLVFRPRR